MRSQVARRRAVEAAGREIVPVSFDSEPLQFGLEPYQCDAPRRFVALRGLNARGTGDTAGTPLARCDDRRVFDFAARHGRSPPRKRHVAS